MSRSCLSQHLIGDFLTSFYSSVYSLSAECAFYVRNSPDHLQPIDTKLSSSFHSPYLLVPCSYSRWIIIVPFPLGPFFVIPIDGAIQISPFRLSQLVSLILFLYGLYGVTYGTMLPKFGLCRTRITLPL